MEFHKLQEIIGITVHVSRVCPTGLCKAFNLIGKLSEAQSSQEKMIELFEEDLEELNFWKTEVSKQNTAAPFMI